MKLRVLSLAVLLLASGMASAAPQLQTCQPMEVTHNGGAGLGYSLSCEAGSWKLNYRGSVPAGTSSVLAQYRLSLTHPDGTNLVQSRTARLPEPSMLGQMLVREAVVLDNGNLALRECPEIGCTLYRPLGGDAKLAKASITVTPELARALAERKQLADQVAEQIAQISALQAREATLSEDLASARQALLTASDRHQAELSSLNEQQAADLSGLQSAHDAQLTASAERWKTGAEAQLSEARLKEEQLSADLGRKVSELTADLASTRDSLQKTQAELAAANEKLASEHTARQDLQGQLEESSTAGEGWARDLAAAKAQASERDQELSTSKADLLKAQESVRALSGALSATEQALVESDAALEAMTSERNVAYGEIKEASEAMLAIIDEYDAMKAKMEQAEASKEAAVTDAANLYTKLEASKLTQELSAQAAQVAHMEVDSLNLQVQGLTAEMTKALELLAASKKELAAQLQEIEQLREEKTKLDQAAAAAADERGATLSKLEEAKREVDELNAQLAAQFNIHGEEVNRLQGQVASCQAAVSALEANHQATLERLSAANAQLAENKACEPIANPN